MKGVGMLVVSLTGVNFEFWSHLGCSGKNTIIFSRDGSRLGLHAKKYNNIYLICIFFWSLLGVKKSLGHAQIGLLQGFNSKFPTSIPTPLMWGVPPGRTTFMHSCHCVFTGIFSRTIFFYYQLLFSFLFFSFFFSHFNDVKVYFCFVLFFFMDIMILFFFFHILYFQCAHTQSGASV